MAVLKKIIPLIIAAILTGCLEEFDPKINSRPVLCMNSLITVGEPITASITRSWLYSDRDGERNHSVENATLTIYANGELKNADYIPQAGDRIKLVAECPGFDNAEAEVTMPEAVPFSAVDWTAAVTYRDILKSSYLALTGIMTFDIRFRLTIADEPDKANYFRFGYEAYQPDFLSNLPFGTVPESYGYLTPGYFDYDSEAIFGEHIGALETISGSTAYGFEFFTDRRFSGKSYTLHVEMESAEFMIVAKELDDRLFDCGYLLKLTSVSESYYNWANYTWQTTDGLIGDMSDFGLADQIWAYSNVSTGAGVVAAQNISTYTVSLSDFLKTETESL